MSSLPRKLGNFLHDLPEAPETSLIKAFFAYMKADAVIGENAVYTDTVNDWLQGFRPWRLIEVSTRDSLLEWAAWTAVMEPEEHNEDDKPSGWSKIRVPILLNFYMPQENRNEDTKLQAIDLLGYIRSKVFAVTFPRTDIPTVTMNLATTDLKYLGVLNRAVDGVRIITYRVVFQLDVDPAQNTFL